MNEILKAKHLQAVQSLEEVVEGVLSGEISPVQAYSVMKDFKKSMDDSLKFIETQVISQIEADPNEYPEFRISTRKTLQYKDNPLYAEKQKELKEIESQIKIATEMHEKGDSYVDSDGVIIDPVEIKFTQVLTYTPKK